MSGYVKRASYPQKGGNAYYCSQCNGFIHKPGCELYIEDESEEVNGGVRNTEAFRKERREMAGQAVSHTGKKPRRKVRISLAAGTAAYASAPDAGILPEAMNTLMGDAHE